MKQSSAPAWLGWRLKIFSLNSGPQNLSCSSRNIQDSFHTLVGIPFPMAFPSFSLRRFLPCKIPLHPCEQSLGRSTSRKFFFWQYFPIRILASRLSVCSRPPSSSSFCCLTRPTRSVLAQTVSFCTCSPKVQSRTLYMLECK